MLNKHHSNKNGFCIVFASLEAHDLGRETAIISAFNQLDVAFAEACKFAVSGETENAMTGCFTGKYAIPINLKKTARTGKLARRGPTIYFDYTDATACECGTQQELPINA